MTGFLSLCACDRWYLLPAAVLAAALTAGASPLGAQQAQGGTACRLQVDVVARPGSDAVPRSNMLAIPAAPGTYEMHLGGGLVTGRCGDARMTGDSAVHREHIAEARMLGEVSYRDSTRTLDADRVTYLGLVDQVIAEVDVRLVRLRSGATLEGPRVEFYRTPTAGGRTIATGRPHMTLPSGGPGTEPFLVDSDVAEFLGDRRAFARGDVQIRRSDMDATADSARFEAEGLGVLYGRPVIRGEGFELTGDSVVTMFSEDDLREVWAFGDAVASGAAFDLSGDSVLVLFENQQMHDVRASGEAVGVGESFELHADRVVARIEEDEVERLWAFGDGRSLAASGGFQLAGDSLEFAFTAGQLDSIAAVGAARSVETPPRQPEAPLVEAELGLDPGGNWLTGDTIRALFAPPDSGDAVPTGEAEADPEPVRITAVGAARSFYALVRDSTRSELPSRNYLLGKRIDVFFTGGEPSNVIALDAIGVYLEPEEGQGGTR